MAYRCRDGMCGATDCEYCGVLQGTLRGNREHPEFECPVVCPICLEYYEDGDIHECEEEEVTD